jgi:hypothetical protein
LQLKAVKKVVYEENFWWCNFDRVMPAVSSTGKTAIPRYQKG